MLHRHERKWHGVEPIIRNLTGYHMEVLTQIVQFHIYVYSRAKNCIDHFINFPATRQMRFAIYIKVYHRDYRIFDDPDKVARFTCTRFELPQLCTGCNPYYSYTSRYTLIK